VLSNATQRALADVWREVLDHPGSIGHGDDFFILGGDSLSVLHLLAAVEDHFGHRVSVGTLLSATTLAAQAAAIESARGEPAPNRLIPLRLTGSRRPWFCVLTDHRGVVGLRNVLPAVLVDQPVYAIQAIDPATPSWRSSSVEEIATACLRAVRSRFPAGPYRLGGHSLGGLVAFEMACRLIGDGERVDLVVLLDTLAPEAHRWFGRMNALDRELRHESLMRRARGQAGVVRRAIHEATTLAHGDRRVRAWPRGFDDPWDRAGAHRIMRRYRPSQLDLPVTVLYTEFGETITAGTDLGWARHVTGSVTARSIPGDHWSMFTEPHVRELARALGDELDKLE
jgi:thioesterase domain-containing protein/acyl carrier protein